MNLVTLYFVKCAVQPSKGYNIKWRIAGSSDPLVDAGNFFNSPAVFTTDESHPPDTEYEGSITAVGNNTDCESVFWSTTMGGGSGSGESGGSGSPELVDINWVYQRSGSIDGQGTIREDGILKASSVPGDSHREGSFVAQVGSDILIIAIAYSGEDVKITVLNQTDNVEEYNTVAAGGLNHTFNPLSGKTYKVTIEINYV